jgi:hypothetical protein
VNFQERYKKRRREVLNLFEGSLLALEKRESLVPCPYVGSICFAGGQDITKDKNGGVGEISVEGNSLARVV